jgi:hypothetical protein
MPQDLLILCLGSLLDEGISQLSAIDDFWPCSEQHLCRTKFTSSSLRPLYSGLAVSSAGAAFRVGERASADEDGYRVMSLWS